GGGRPSGRAAAAPASERGRAPVPRARAPVRAGRPRTATPARPAGLPYAWPQTLPPPRSPTPARPVPICPCYAWADVHSSVTSGSEGALLALDQAAGQRVGGPVEESLAGRLAAGQGQGHLATGGGRAGEVAVLVHPADRNDDVRRAREP